MNKLVIILSFLGFQNILGQSHKHDFSDDLYVRSIQYYVDSVIIKYNHYDSIVWSNLPKQFQYSDYLVVGDSRIIYRLPNKIRYIDFNKMEKLEFCAIKNPKEKWDRILFVSPAIINGLKVSIKIYQYYTQDDNCKVIYDVGYEFAYRYNINENLYKLDIINSEVLVIK